MRAIAALAVAALLSHYTAADNPIIGHSSVILLLVGCWSLVTTLQLWRTLRVFTRLGLYTGAMSNVPANLESVQRRSGADRADG